jgi:hypothetical protein
MRPSANRPPRATVVGTGWRRSGGSSEAVGFHVQLKVLDPILALSPFGVELVEGFGLLGPRGHHEASVRPLLHRLGLVDDPARMLPASRLVEILREESLLRSLGLMQIHRLIEQSLGDPFEAGVGDQTW